NDKLVILDGTSEDSANISTDQTNTLHTTVRNTDSANNYTVLIDLEAINANGQKIGQQFFDNTTFQPGQSQTFELTTPANLPPGTYHFSVGIFETSWQSLIHWYDTIQTFTVQ